MPIGDLRENHTMNASTYVSDLEMHIWRRDNELGMVVDGHLGGLLGVGMSMCSTHIILVLASLPKALHSSTSKVLMILYIHYFWE